MNIVHHLYPPHLVGRLEVFVDLGEVGIEPTFTEQGEVPSATVFLEIVEVQLSVFADWLLFGKLHIGNEVAVFLAVCTSELFVNGFCVLAICGYDVQIS